MGIHLLLIQLNRKTLLSDGWGDGHHSVGQGMVTADELLASSTSSNIALASFFVSFKIQDPGFHSIIQETGFHSAFTILKIIQDPNSESWISFRILIQDPDLGLNFIQDSGPWISFRIQDSEFHSGSWTKFRILIPGPEFHSGFMVLNFIQDSRSWMKCRILDILGLHLYGLPSKYDPQQRYFRNPHSRQSGKTPVGPPPEAPSGPYFCWLFRNSMQTKDFTSKNWPFIQAGPSFISVTKVFFCFESLPAVGVCTQRKEKHTPPRFDVEGLARVRSVLSPLPPVLPSFAPHIVADPGCKRSPCKATRTVSTGEL